MLLLAASVLATGCTQLRSIESDALVVGVGLDPGPQPGTFGILAQWFYHGAPTGSSGGGAGGGGGGGSSAQVQDILGQGPTVAQAMSQVQEQTDQRVSFLALQLIVMGDSLARGGVDVSLDDFWRSGDVFSLSQVAVAKGSAAKLLATPMTSGTAYSLYQRLTMSGSTQTGSIPIPLWEFMSRANSPYMAAWAPLFAPTRAGYQGVGTAVFRGDRLVDELGVSETATLSWLLKAAGYEYLVVPGGSGSQHPAVLRVNSRTVHIAAASAETGSIDLTLHTQLKEGWGVAVAGADAAALQAAATVQATHDVERLLARLQADDSDVLGFGERLRERDPAAAAAWPDAFRAMHIAVHVAVQLQAAGRER